jgi:hypothetical protein
MKVRPKAVRFRLTLGDFSKNQVIGFITFYRDAHNRAS